MPHYLLDARTATPHFPGIGRYVRSLAPAMVTQLGPDERLQLLIDPGQLLSLDGATRLPVAASPFSFSQQWRVPQAIRSLDAGLYHSPYYLMPYLPAAPTVLTVYDVIPLKYPQFTSARARLLFRVTTALALRSARHVIAITENARQEFIITFRVRPERITAVPLAADASFRPQPAQEVEAVRRKYNLPARFVLYLGSNKPHKNLVGLVRAWLAMSKVDASLVVAGAWDARYPEARQLADAQPDTSICWLGPIEDADLPALYAAATVFVFPSLFEGFGLPVIEAMACGTPVICSNVTALPEVAGDSAITVDPSNQEGLGAALERVLPDDNLRADLTARGLARAAHFSWERTAAQTLEIYRRVTA